MNYRLLKQVLKDGLRGIRMCFFSSRRDKYGSIHPSVIVYQPFMGVKENMFLDKGCVIHEYARILAHKGKFVMKRNCVAATGLTVIAQNHDNNNIGDIPGGGEIGGMKYLMMLSAMKMCGLGLMLLYVQELI